MEPTWNVAQLTSKCSDLPQYFYRVQYAGTVTRRLPNGSFRAARMAVTEQSLLSDLSKHLSWDHSPTPFISVFDDRIHAENWALKRDDDDNTEILTISTAHLASTRVFSVSCVTSFLGLRLGNADRHAHEFLCLGSIPAAAVTQTEACSALRGRREQAKEAQLERQEHLDRIAARDPHYHYNAEIGWYDSEDEAEIRNTNDNLMKMIEENW